MSLFYSLLARLSLMQKFVLAFIPLSFAVVVLYVQYYNTANALVVSSRSELEGAGYLSFQMDLLSKLQKHRGLGMLTGAPD